MIKQFYKRIIQLNILRACFGQSFFKTRSFFSSTKVFNNNMIKLYFKIQSKKMDKLGIIELTKEKLVLFHRPYRIDYGISKTEGLVAFGVGHTHLQLFKMKTISMGFSFILPSNMNFINMPFLRPISTIKSCRKWV